MTSDLNVILIAVFGGAAVLFSIVVVAALALSVRRHERVQRHLLEKVKKLRQDLDAILPSEGPTSEIPPTTPEAPQGPASRPKRDTASHRALRPESDS